MAIIYSRLSKPKSLGAPVSIKDEVMNDMTEEQARCIPRGCEHSVAWCIWHMARIEDVTMSLIVAGGSQVLHRGKRLKRKKIAIHDPCGTIYSI